MDLKEINTVINNIIESNYTFGKMELALEIKRQIKENTKLKERVKELEEKNIKANLILDDLIKQHS